MSLAGAGRSPQSSPRQRSAPSGAIYSPHKQVADLRRLGVKGHCPLRVQGGARNLHRVSGQRRQAQFIPHISKSQICALLPKAIKRGFAAQPFLDKASRLAPPCRQAIERSPQPCPVQSAKRIICYPLLSPRKTEQIPVRRPCPSAIFSPQPPRAALRRPQNPPLRRPASPAFYNRSRDIFSSYSR